MHPITSSTWIDRAVSHTKLVPWVKHYNNKNLHFQTMLFSNSSSIIGSLAQVNSKRLLQQHICMWIKGWSGQSASYMPSRIFDNESSFLSRLPSLFPLKSTYLEPIIKSRKDNLPQTYCHPSQNLVLWFRVKSSPKFKTFTLWTITLLLTAHFTHYKLNAFE